jgi:hypothetical protein
MKRSVCIILFLAVTVLLAVGQTFSVVIHNAESSNFYYVLDPPELTVFDTSASIFQSVVYDYFADAPEATDEFSGFTEIEPGASRSVDLSEGKHLLVGFFAIPGRREFPVRVITVQSGGGLDVRNYTVYSEPSLIQARAGRGRISAYKPVPAAAAPAVAAAPGAAPAVGEQTPAQVSEEAGFFRFAIDNRYDDWEAIPTFLSFSAERDLPSFTSEQYGAEFEVLPIERSRHWGQGGTAINEVKVVDNVEAIYLYISTHSAISANLSVFLYFHSDRNLKRPGARNQFTLEMVPQRAEEPGLVVLWEKQRQPVIVGKLASGSFFLEARIDKDELYDLLYVKPEITFFDMTTSFFDRQELAYEEFYITSVPLNSIPTEKTLY